MVNISRRPSIISKDRNLTCRICLREKPETKFLTPQIKPGDPLPKDRDPKMICRACNEEIVQDWRASGDRRTSAARLAAEERVAARYRRATSVQPVPQGRQPPMVDPVEPEPVQEADDQTPPSGGQGFMSEVETKLAIEEHAMELAMNHYGGLGLVERVDRDRSKSWDVECTSGDEVKRVEVKGSSGDGSRVFLTANEADNASTYRPMALFVVPHIKVIQDESGIVQVTGSARPCILDPWMIDLADLTPTEYRYRVPGC
jgi:hypothetical protein